MKKIKMYILISFTKIQDKAAGRERRQGRQMKKGIKIATIGGGSSYTPELMEGFIKRYQELPIREIWLVDVEEGKEKLSIIGGLTKRMWKAAGYPVEIHTTLNRQEALKDADFVTTQFRVGFLDARIKDERIPLLHGMLGQETNGAGGIFKALRTIPVMEGIVEDMRRLCPNAWLINFTNPSGIITEAVIRRMGWKRCIGLCNVPVISMMSEPGLIGKKPGELNYRFAGLNHFHWHRVFDESGKEVTGRILEHINEKNGGTPVNIYHAPFPMDILRSMKAIPCGYHRYYIAQKEMLVHSLEEFHTERGTRAEQMKETERELFALYRNPELSKKPEQLSRRGGAYYSDAACECINAIYNDKKIPMVVSTENNGAIPCLPSDCIVEVSAVISAAGAWPMVWGEMSGAMRGQLQLMKAMEECVIQAAMYGDPGALKEAFMLNPLIENGGEGDKVLKELLIAHEKYLPRFGSEIPKLKEEGWQSQDPVVRVLTEDA
ncbi:6-phospho-beta-glucosidase [Parablautia intestinalis]|uniref:6-phospho-beta-glucosidase n=1 Tax=Parablautia intestinalis TaxID=2320100 RepID=UPI002F3E7ED5